MSQLPVADLVVLFVYFAGITLLGTSFVRTSKTTRDFMVAGTGLPGWAVGLSIFATYLSSNTFLGVPGKAYATNWNAFVFSLSIPIAAWIGLRYFVPFYRQGEDISAYTHLEKRFGPWARLYAVLCYLLTQLARTGTILFGMALALQALLGWRIETIILITGLLTTLYTMLGGIRAAVWTDVVQSFILTGGAILVVVLILCDIPGGPGEAISIAAEHGKFSLGSFSLDPCQSTFWVVLSYGLFINLTNFGIDQNYIQRYHTAKTDAAAARSLWLGAILYVPVSLLFFVIGTALFAYYHTHDGALSELKATVAAHRITTVASQSTATSDSDALTDADIGDRVFPHFIATRMPRGCAGLVIAAVLAAAMSTISTSLNSSATVYLKDIHERYVSSDADAAGAMRVLHGFTLFWGLAGTGAALAMIGVKSILETWWMLSGIFAGGMLGLFLLGVMFPRAGHRPAAIGVVLGVAITAWMTLSPGSRLPIWLQNPLDQNLVIVAGTLVIIVAGVVSNRFLSREAD